LPITECRPVDVVPEGTVDVQMQRKRPGRRGCRVVRVSH